jgi:hypothetical protein
MTQLPDQDLPLHGPTDDAGDGQVVEEAKAKQGLRGRHALVILISSLLLAVLVLFGLWGLNSGSLGVAAHTDRPAPAATKTP